MRADRRAALPVAPGLAGMAGLPASAGVASQGLWVAAGLSAAVHLAVAGWFAATGLFAHVEESAAPSGPKVELISSAAFDAMQSVAPVIEASAPMLTSPPPPAEVSGTEVPEPDQAQMAVMAAMSAPTEDAVPQVADAPPAAPERQPAKPVAVPETKKPKVEKVVEAKPEKAPEPEEVSAPVPEPAPAVEPAPAAKPKSGGKAKAASAGKGEASLMSDWGGKIRSKINRAKSYPKAERAAGVTGTVTLKLTVSSGGQVLGVAVAQGSGSQALDAAAVSAVKRAGRLPKAPDGLGKDQYSFSLPVTFTR